MRLTISFFGALLTCVVISACTVSLSVRITNQSGRVVFIKGEREDTEISLGSRTQNRQSFQKSIVLLIDGREFRYVSRLPDDSFITHDRDTLRVDFELRRDLKLYLMTKTGQVGNQPKGFPLSSGTGRGEWISPKWTGYVE